MIGRFWRWQLQPEPAAIVHVERDMKSVATLADGPSIGSKTVPSPVPLAPSPRSSETHQLAVTESAPPARVADSNLTGLSLVQHVVHKPGQLAPIIDGFSWDFAAARTYFVIGRNGVGKSLFLKSLTLAGVASVRPSSRRAPVYFAARDRICDEAVRVGGIAYALAGPVQGDNALNTWGLTGFAHRDVRGLSQGERTRLMLALASMRDPDVLLLDEPTLGLDQKGLSSLHRFLAERRTRKRLTLVASHELTVFDHDGGELLMFEHDHARTRISHATGRVLTASAEFGAETVLGAIPEVARALIDAQVAAIIREEGGA